MQTRDTIHIKQNRKHVGEEEIEVDPMSCYPEKKSIRNKNIYLSIYNEILLELIIRWEKIRNRLIFSVMLGKLLWVGGTLMI